MKKLIIILVILSVLTISAYAQMGGQQGQMRQGMMGGMMGQTSDCQSRIKCAEQWLNKAIDLHEIHLKDPKTATEASQMEMMASKVARSLGVSRARVYVSKHRIAALLKKETRRLRAITE